LNFKVPSALLGVPILIVPVFKTFECPKLRVPVFLFPVPMLLPPVPTVITEAVMELSVARVKTPVEPVDEVACPLTMKLVLAES
jgi:hypothetical protein